MITGDWHSAFVDDGVPDFDEPDAPVIGTESTAYSPVRTFATFHVDRGRPGSREDRVTADSPNGYHRGAPSG